MHFTDILKVLAKFEICGRVLVKSEIGDMLDMIAGMPIAIEGNAEVQYHNNKGVSKYSKKSITEQL